jgi:tRNA-dihydrouridine synthase
LPKEIDSEYLILTNFNFILNQGTILKVHEEKKVKTLLLGNGDVQSLKEAREKVQLFGLDGVMIGIRFE